MRRPRTVDINYYEWSVIRWLTSTTRSVLSPEGRYIFRELLDQCYVAGGIPKDLELMARKVECTDEQMRRVWPLIEHHFQTDKKDKKILFFAPARAWRTSFFRYLSTQRTNGMRGGRNKGPVNGHGFNGIETNGVSLSDEAKRTKRTNIKRADEAKESPPPAQQSRSSEEPEQSAASVSSPPPLDSPPAAAIEPQEIPEIDKLCFISRELTYYVNELCHLGWQPADEKICAEILKAIEGDLDFFIAKLQQLWKSRRAAPKKSYGWFTSVLRKES
jgi:hypothetical protein